MPPFFSVGFPQSLKVTKERQFGTQTTFIRRPRQRCWLCIFWHLLAKALAFLLMGPKPPALAFHSIAFAKPGDNLQGGGESRDKLRVRCHHQPSEYRIADS